MAASALASSVTKASVTKVLITLEKGSSTKKDFDCLHNLNV